jgi:NitT/TauT family transport system substrate-binding protein
MALKIMPHGRLQEWVAQENGYFTAEGLEYSFVISGDYGMSSVQRDAAGEVRTGAFETFGAGAAAPMRAVPVTGPRTPPRAKAPATW